MENRQKDGELWLTGLQWRCITPYRFSTTLSIQGIPGTVEMTIHYHFNLTPKVVDQGELIGYRPPVQYYRLAWATAHLNPKMPFAEGSQTWKLHNCRLYPISLYTAPGAHTAGHSLIKTLNQNPLPLIRQCRYSNSTSVGWNANIVHHIQSGASVIRAPMIVRKVFEPSPKSQIMPSWPSHMDQSHSHLPSVAWLRMHHCLVRLMHI